MSVRGRGGLGSDDCLSKPGRGRSHWVAVEVEGGSLGTVGSICCRSAPAMCPRVEGCVHCRDAGMLSWLTEYWFL